MVYPSSWMWLVAIALTVAGLWLSPALGVDKLIARLPGWFCALLALVWLVGMWYLLHTQFDGLAFRMSLP